MVDFTAENAMRLLSKHIPSVVHVQNSNDQYDVAIRCARSQAYMSRFWLTLPTERCECLQDLLRSTLEGRLIFLETDDFFLEITWHVAGPGSRVLKHVSNFEEIPDRIVTYTFEPNTPMEYMIEHIAPSIKKWHSVLCDALFCVELYTAASPA